MLNFFSFILTISGALIIAFSVWRLYSILKFFKSYTQGTKGSACFLNCACLVMMVIFFIGYLIYAAAIFIIKDLDMVGVLVAVIFALGSIFVYAMVTMQNRLSHTISQRSLEMTYSLISAVEAKDKYTKGHSEHVKYVTKLFYEHLPDKYQSVINLEMLLDAAMLHDIGKIGIPDSILNKQGALTDDEYAIIKQHPKRGYDILKNTVYYEIAKWILYHHERVDGKGYYGIQNDDLPLEAKIIAITDTFSALFTDRVYRKKHSFEQTIEIMKNCSKTQLDGELVDIFCTIEQYKFIQISNQNELPEHLSELIPQA